MARAGVDGDVAGDAEAAHRDRIVAVQHVDVDGSDGIEEIIVEGCSVDGRDVRGRRGARETNAPGNAEDARLNLANRDAVVGTVAGDAEQTGGRIFSGVNDARQKHAVFESFNIQGPTQAVDSTLLHHGMPPQSHCCREKVRNYLPLPGVRGVSGRMKAARCCCWGRARWLETYHRRQAEAPSWIGSAHGCTSCADSLCAA